MIRTFAAFAAVVVMVLGSMHAMAAGVLQLTGKVVAFSSNEVTIEVRKKKLYIIDRTNLAPQDSSKIFKAGQDISLNVPMQSVKNVKDLKKSRG